MRVTPSRAPHPGHWPADPHCFGAGPPGPYPRLNLSRTHYVPIRSRALGVPAFAVWVDAIPYWTPAISPSGVVVYRGDRTLSQANSPIHGGQASAQALMMFFLSGSQILQ